MDELNEVARMEIQPGWDVYTADDEALGQVDSVGDVSFTVTGMAASTAQANATRNTPSSTPVDSKPTRITP